MVEIEAGERNILLINVYAPTEKRNKDALYERLSRCIRNVEKLDSYALIIGGDFNCVNDASFDAIGCRTVYKQPKEYTKLVKNIL